jgi:pyruvate formate lyase activating enzyme
VKTAEFYRIREDGKLQCLLCPHLCIISEGKAGTCGVRRNVKGELIAETYRKVSALHYDPIEKKPLYHFYPGSVILSIGSVGCNLNCSFCQNCDISRADVPGYPWFKDYSVGDVVSMASAQPGNIGISFTYNEPTISYEYMMEISQLASSAGLKTAMVSNGYINPDPLVRLLPFMDAFNIDLKAFRDDFYRKHTGARLAPVLETLRILKEAGKHFEITNLVIPGLNDDPVIFGEMTDWIAGELGEYSVLHISRYFPHHRMNRPATPVSTLEQLYGIAKQRLHNVYLGNVTSRDGRNTYCIQCGELLISRNGYRTSLRGIAPDLHCKNCNTPIQNMVL